MSLFNLSTSTEYLYQYLHVTSISVMVSAKLARACKANSVYNQLFGIINARMTAPSKTVRDAFIPIPEE